MPSDLPFFDRSERSLDTDQVRSLDTDQILYEAIPIASLVALFGGLALIPFLVATLIGPYNELSLLFTVLGQFVLAVGTGIVLLYLLVRAQQLA